MISPARNARAGANGIPNSRHTKNAQTPYSPPRMIWLRMKPAAADPTLRRKSIASSRFSGGVRSRPARMILSLSIAMKTARLITTITSTNVPNEDTTPPNSPTIESARPLRRSATTAWKAPTTSTAMPRASNQDWMSARIDGGLAARPGNAAAISTNESTSETRTFTITRAHTRMTGTMTATTATGRGRRVSRRWSQSATGETRNASSQAKKKMRMIRK